MKKEISKSKIMKRLLALSMSMVLFVSQCMTLQAAPSEAAQGQKTEQAALPTEKEEVVYAILNSDGSVDGVYVVNSFTDNNIVDYGNYTSVRNLTTTDNIEMKNGVIKIQTEADKLYYQGNLKTKEIPWNISIHHSINGKEYPADKIAGLDGKWEMTLSITQNENCDSRFWDGHALQISFSLDSGKCKNIESENATIANVGSDKQLSYIVLPQKGAEIKVTADVTEFEMSELAINATKLNLDVELDSSELTDKIQEVKDAVQELDDGALELDDGALELKDGAGELYDGTVEINDGVATLQDGVSELNDGMEELKDALETLDDNSDDLKDGSAELLAGLKTLEDSLEDIPLAVDDLITLSQASTQMKGGIDSLVGGLEAMAQQIDEYYTQLNGQLEGYGINGVSGLAEYQKTIAETLASSGDQTYAGYAAVLDAGASYMTSSDQVLQGIQASLDASSGELMVGALTLQTNYTAFDTQIQGMVSSLGTLASSMSELKSGVDKLVSGSESLNGGVNEYTDAVGKIVDGFDKLYDGTLEVANGTAELYDGTQEAVDGALELYNGSVEMKDGTAELKDGTTEFYEESNTMDTEIEDTIDDTISEMTGKEVETISFVSEKNTNVKSVLFVIKAPAIEVEEAEEIIVEEAEELTFWQKFLKLFGL